MIIINNYIIFVIRYNLIAIRKYRVNKLYISKIEINKTRFY